MGLRKYIENLRSDKVEADTLEVDGNQSNYGWVEVGRVRSPNSTETTSFDVEGEVALKVEIFWNNQNSSENIDMTFNNNTNTIYNNVYDNAGSITTSTGETSHQLVSQDRYDTYTGEYIIGIEWDNRNSREMLTAGTSIGTSSGLSGTNTTLKYGVVNSDDLGDNIETIDFSYGGSTEGTIIVYKRDI